MVRVDCDSRQADRWMCYAAFAIVLGQNKKKSVAGIQQVICDKFLSRLKYVDKFGIAAVLSSPKNSDLVSKMGWYPRSYTLTSELYGALTKRIELETKSLLELCSMPYSTEAGITLLYERMRGSKLPPTLPSVFRQARDALRGADAH